MNTITNQASGVVEVCPDCDIADCFHIRARRATPARPTMRDELQRKCSDWGTYWRASDAHGVELTKPQAIELLQDALGVEVELKDNGCETCDGVGMIGGPSFYEPGEGGVPCPDCTPPAASPSTSELQPRVQPWLMECFGPMIAGDRAERNHRFIEEALELVQSCGCTASEAHQLVDYVFGRPVGEKGQEVGGTMITLAALCLANNLDMHAEGECELARITQPDMVLKIRAKQAAKPKHSPLPIAPPAATVPERLTEFPGMTEELASILGTMCFQCITFAHALRAAGHQIKSRAEDEQAAVLHWMLGHYFRHGAEGWRKAAVEDMQRMRDASRPAGEVQP